MPEYFRLFRNREHTLIDPAQKVCIVLSHPGESVDNHEDEFHSMFACGG
jgi:hypothetical protein